MNKKEQPAFWTHFVAGGAAATVGATLTCPLEVVKTRLQSSLYKPRPNASLSSLNIRVSAWGHIKGVVELLKQIKQTEGIRALWKGIGPNLVGVAPARAIYFAVYSQGKHAYTVLNNDQETSLVHMLAAATAGAATALGTNPIWLVKTRIQLQSENSSLVNIRKYRNSFHCAMMVVQEEGIRGLYRGFSASILGLSESTLQFVLYERLKKSFRESSSDSLNDSFLGTFSAAAIAKLSAAIVTYPHEVLRTRLRQSPSTEGVQKYKGLIQASKLIYKEEGMLAFYGGMTAHLMRVVPNAAIMFFCYELFVKLMSSSDAAKK